MRIIGLCGRSGSGKGVFSKVASENGFFVIDCDAVYKELVSSPSPCLNEIENAFGSFVVKHGSLDRRALAPIVFSDKEKLELLNSIAHKHILAEIETILSTLGEEEIVLLDAPTLFESGINEMCDLVVGVLASDELCVRRIVLRDDITEASALARLANQKSNEFLIENCDCLVYNESTADEFAEDSALLLKSIKEGSL